MHRPFTVTRTEFQGINFNILVVIHIVYEISFFKNQQNKHSHITFNRKKMLAENSLRELWKSCIHIARLIFFIYSVMFYQYIYVIEFK